MKLKISKIVQIKVQKSFKRDIISKEEILTLMLSLLYHSTGQKQILG